MIDFNGISTLLGLFYSSRLENHIHCMFIFTFFMQLFLKSFFFALGHIGNKWFINKSIWPIDGTLTGTTTPGQSGTGSNGNKRVLHSPQSSRTETRYSLVSYSGYPIFFFGGGGYSQHNLSLINKVATN